MDIFKIAILAAILVYATKRATSATPPGGQTENPIVTKAKQDLSTRTGIAVANIKTISFEQVSWPDSSLGCQQPGSMYAQVVTPGYKIVLDANGQTYDYRSNASGSSVLLCVSS